MNLKSTLGSERWLRENEVKIKNLFPETWTHFKNINGAKVMFQMKLLGVEFFDDETFVRIMQYLEELGIVLRQDYTVRRNPGSIFNTSFVRD